MWTQCAGCICWVMISCIALRLWKSSDYIFLSFFPFFCTSFINSYSYFNILYCFACSVGSIYLTFVLVIGRFIHNFISGLPSDLTIDEIANPDLLIQHCHDIFLLRKEKKFKEEKKHVKILFSIFRSPEKIIQLTKETKVKTE